MHSELTPPYFETDNEDRKGIWDGYAVGGKIQTIVRFEKFWSQERTIEIITISYVSASDKRTNNRLKHVCNTSIRSRNTSDHEHKKIMSVRDALYNETEDSAK